MSRPRHTVSISTRAEGDLRRIADYYAETRSIDDAVEMIDAITGQIARLEQFPERGAVPNEVRDLEIGDYRQAIVRPFRIFYLVDDVAVTIVMIADGRRDIGSLLRERLIGSDG